MADLTQRAYTLKLRGIDKKNNNWRDKLWLTHEAVNNGVKSFGDWLLTFRGGISHDLICNSVDSKNLNDEEIRNQRILIALSWLSVESEKGAPAEFIINFDLDSKTGERKWKTVETLQEILLSKNLSKEETQNWIDDCKTSISAEIREDAVWVNRNKAFANFQLENKIEISKEDIWDLLDIFFSNKKSYLKGITVSKDNNNSQVKTKAEEPKDLSQKARGWLSRRFGKGKSANFGEFIKVYEGIKNYIPKVNINVQGKEFIKNLAKELGILKKDSSGLEDIFELLRGPGYKSSTKKRLENIFNKNELISNEILEKLKKGLENDIEKCNNNKGKKGDRLYSNYILKCVEEKCGINYFDQNGVARINEYSVILDHAARRVSIVHSWIKRAEATRTKFDDNIKKLDNVTQDAKQWLDNYCEIRGETNNSLNEYLINERAISSWELVVNEWSNIDCKTESDRLSAAKKLQNEIEGDKKFGDINLFSDLSTDEAKCVWFENGNSNINILKNYVEGTNALSDKKRYKVPAYRHPDPLLHPVFCDFGDSRWNIFYDIKEYYRVNKKKTKTQNLKELNIHGLKLTLFDGTDVNNTDLLWSSKLFFNDLALNEKNNLKDDFVEISRASRFGKAVKNVTNESKIKIAEIFNVKKWNGRLQAPREQLEKIAKLKSLEKVVAMRRKIKWFITFSPNLSKMGPWKDYLNENKNLYEEIKKENKIRGKKNKLILSRLPNLRILSIDLGHRFAAACAVWETLTIEQMKQICLNSGYKTYERYSDSTFLYIKSNDDKKNTIYRRIAPDFIDDKVHPAPWAKLTRQFLIKLQGEEFIRKFRPDELNEYKNFKNEIGSIATTELSTQVDELMHETLYLARQGLKRHSDRARIANFLISEYKLNPGGVKVKLDSNGKIEIILDALLLWYELFNNIRWSDDWAKNKWNEHIKPILKDFELKKIDFEADFITKNEFKKQKDELRNSLKPVAIHLSQQNNMKLHVDFAMRWQNDDKIWRKRIRVIKDWILPRGINAKNPEIRLVGGLSVSRITNITSLYKIQKAYFQRLTPKNNQNNIDEIVTIKKEFAQSTLNTIENLREQRVKQLSSRIIEAALGLGRISKKDFKKNSLPQNISKDWRNKIKRHLKPVDETCQAVIIENLTSYKPDQTKTRRENSQLMSWSSSRVKEYLSEGCDLYGLELREVSANYTSRQDSRTGYPGVRCIDVPQNKFLESKFWLKEISKSEKKVLDKKANLKDKYLLEITDLIKKGNLKNQTIRIPINGGSIFVSADSNSPLSNGIQADLNAAANIGLKALLDPDWIGKWWYITCDKKTYKPLKDDFRGSLIIDTKNSIKQPVTVNKTDAKKINDKKENKNNNTGKNLWHDINTSSLIDRNWEEFEQYWNNVLNRVVHNLRHKLKIK